MILQLLPLQAQTGAGIAPFAVGGFALFLLLAMLVALLSFGKGRDHS